jgi:hypothetical protein
MSDGSYDRLRARVNMDVLDNNPLFSTATKLGQRVHLIKIKNPNSPAMKRAAEVDWSR